MRRLIDDRFVFNESDGSVPREDAFVANVLDLGIRGETLHDRSVIVEGDGAITFGTTDLRFGQPGEPDTLPSLRDTSTFVERDGQWRMLTPQMQRATRP